MKSKKQIALFLVMVLVILSFAACGDKNAGKGNEGDKTPTQSPQKEEEPAVSEPIADTLENPNISVVYWYNPDQYAYDITKNENVYDPILEAVPDFEEKYGGKVNVIYAAWDSMLETVIALQNSGDAPDLFEVYDRNMYNVVLSNIAQPIDQYVTDQDYSYWDVDRSLFSWKGQTYAIPIKPYTYYIMFNRDLFALEGLTPPDELFRAGQWTFDEFEKAIKALTKKVDGEVTQYGYGSYDDTITYFMLVNGGALLDVDTQNGKVKSMLSDPKVQNTVTYMTRWMDSMILGYDMFGWWDNGALGMIRGKEFPVDHPFEVGVVPYPTGPDMEGKNLVVYPQGFAVPQGAKNPAGAAAFMRIVNEKQLAVGDKKEANRIGQENYDMIYADDVKLVYAYDKNLDDVDHIVGSIINFMRDGVPASTIGANMDPEINASVELIFGPQE
ncbi:ABC-type glycerol-3-phosphate transport system substrate-binding protein [Anaerotaenia torta]|uniref:ABC transporter substrate-binding protein n=1 Tax=Anaerotaenia torta TaxID=433293 RepID=UPI003D1A4144